MGGHQSNLVCAFLVIDINGTQKRGVLKIVAKGHERKIRFRKFRPVADLTFRLKILDIFIMLLLNEKLDSV